MLPAYWLGMPLHSSSYILLPRMSQLAFGDNQADCGGNSDRIIHHKAIRDVVFSVAQSAALAPFKELSNLIPSSVSRPANVFIPTWSHRQPAALDVHVISPLPGADWGRLPSLLAMPCRLVSNGSWLPTSQPAGRWGWSSSRLWWRL